MDAAYTQMRVLGILMAHSALREIPLPLTPEMFDSALQGLAEPLLRGQLPGDLEAALPLSGWGYAPRNLPGLVRKTRLYAERLAFMRSLERLADHGRTVRLFAEV